MVKVKVKTTGGDKLKRHMQAQLRAVRDVPREIKIGFVGNKFLITYQAHPAQK